MLLCCTATTPAGLSSPAAIVELAGSGRLQLTAATSRAFVEFWNDGRPGIFAATVNGGAHAYQYCRNGICTFSQAQRVVEDCNDSFPVMLRTCAILVVGPDIVWRGEVLDPYRRQSVLVEHNRMFAQAMVFEFPDDPEQAVATVFIDRALPIGQFTIEPNRFGGFCQGTYDFSSADNRFWDLRCLNGYQASGTLQADDLAIGGSGTGADGENGEVRLTLMPRG